MKENKSNKAKQVAKGSKIHKDKEKFGVRSKGHKSNDTCTQSLWAKRCKIQTNLKHQFKKKKNVQPTSLMMWVCLFIFKT